MHTLVLVLLGFHVLPAVFWTGSTMVWARGETPTAPLLRAQLGSAIVAIASGAGLWHALHRGAAHDLMGQVVAAGALAAIVALALQVAIVTPAARRLRGASQPDLARLHARIAKGQRAAAPLLMIAVVCMVTARYV